MKKRYKASFDGKYLLESSAKYDRRQLDDMNRIMEEFGNLILREVKANPAMLDQMDIPEPANRRL